MTVFMVFGKDQPLIACRWFTREKIPNISGRWLQSMTLDHVGHRVYLFGTNSDIDSGCTIDLHTPSVDHILGALLFRHGHLIHVRLMDFAHRHWTDKSSLNLHGSRFQFSRILYSLFLCVSVYRCENRERLTRFVGLIIHFSAVNSIWSCLFHRDCRYNCGGRGY